MTCQEFWDRLPEIADAESHPHAVECAACTARLARNRALQAGLKRLAAEMRNVEAPARVEAGLLAAFRTQHHPARKQAPQWWAPAMSWAAAAAILAMVALALLHPKQPAAPHRMTTSKIELASLSESQDAASPDADDDFIPLPNAEKLDPNEDVNVVRMEVPRSAMMAVGLAVSADQVSELVEADVMLGQDGIARAIRFVNE